MGGSSDTDRGVSVSCHVKHRPVAKARDYILIDCADEEKQRIHSCQVYRKASVTIVAVDWEQRAFKFSTDSHPDDVATFRKAVEGMVCHKVLAFQKLDERNRMPKMSQLLSAGYTQICDVPEKIFSPSYSTNPQNGTFWKVDEQWIYLNPEPWQDFQNRIVGKVLDQEADRIFALSLHEHSGTYLYPGTWDESQPGCTLDSYRFDVCSDEEWAQGKYDRNKHLRPGTRFVRLGFLINLWNGDPKTKPDSEGFTDNPLPFLWNKASFSVL